MEKTFKLTVKKNYLGFLIRKNMRFIALMTVTMVVFNPILVLMFGTLNRYTNTLIMTGRILNLLLALASCFVSAFLVFSFLNGKNKLDVYHALPIKRESLFLTTYVAGLVLIVIPFAISWLTAAPLGWLAADVRVTDCLWDFILVLGPLFATYSFVVFAQVNTGTMIDALIYALILMFVTCFGYLAVHTYASAFLLGYDTMMRWDWLRYLTPVYALFSNIAHKIFALKVLLKVDAYWVGVSLALCGAGVFIYRARPSEAAQSPFTNRFFFPVVSVSLIAILQLILYSFFYLAGNSEVPFNSMTIGLSLLIAMVLYIIMDAVATRSFKNIWKSALVYLIVGLAAFALTLPVYLTRGFGYVTAVPNDAQSVTISYYDDLGLLVPSNHKDLYVYQGTYRSEIKLTEPKDIAVITNLHKLILTNYRYFDYKEKKLDAHYSEVRQTRTFNTFDGLDYEGRVMITIGYQLKNGKTLTRSYSIPYEWTASLLNLFQSDAIIKQRIPMAYYHRELSSISSIRLTDALLTNGIGVNSQFDFDEFAEAYLKDYRELSVSDLTSTDYRYYGRLVANVCMIKNDRETYCTEDYLDIDSRYLNTLNYLDMIDMGFIKTDPTVQGRILIPSTENRSNAFNIAGANYYGLQEHAAFLYSDLSFEQIEALKPFLIPYGISTTPTMIVKIDDNLFHFDGYYLVNPDHYAEALQIVDANTMTASGDLYESLY